MGFPAYQPAPALPVQAPIDLGPLQKILTAAPNTKGLAKTAAAQASQQVNSQLAAIQAAQQGELQQAAGRAREINAASLAGSNYLDSLGFAERLRAALQQAGQDQAAFAQGFSGDLRQTAEADAAKVNQSIAAIGGTGQVPNADALANTVYGLGRIPADVLTSSAPYVYAQAQTLPASLLAAGREQAVGALGAGQQAAAQYRPQIAAAIGSLPKLSREILSDLTTAAEKARQDAIGHMFEALKLQQAGRSEEATQAWRNAQLQGDQWKTYLDAINRHQDLIDTRTWHTQSLEADRAYHDQLAQDRADTLAEMQAYHKATLAKPDWTTVSDAKGTYLIDRKDGTKIKVAGPSQTAVNAQEGAPTTIGTSGHYQAWNPKTHKFEYLPGNKPPTVTTPTSSYRMQFDGAVTLANTLRASGGEGDSFSEKLSSALSGGTSRPYKAALRQVTAYLRGSGVPQARVAKMAQRALLAAGYRVPKKGKPGFFDDPEAFVGSALPG